MTSPTTTSAGAGSAGAKRFPFVSLVVGLLLAATAFGFLASGAALLWKDRVDRDSAGFVSIGTNDLNADTPAILGELKGDGPSWLWGSAVMGDGRIRASSRTGEPLFVGIARTEDIEKYLNGAGYTTIEHFTTSARTTHAGRGSAGAPSGQNIWSASAQGKGEQSLVWTPRDGDWSVVFMNADGSAPIAMRGDLSAELPPLRWLEATLLTLGALFVLLSAVFLVHTYRRAKARSAAGRSGARRPAITGVPAGADG